MPHDGLSRPAPRGRLRPGQARPVRRLRRNLRQDLPPLTDPAAGGAGDLRASRRQLVIDGLGIVVSAAGFGFVFGLTARTSAGFSPLEAMAFSLVAFAGAAQFAAVGFVARGLGWPAIALFTLLLNARHVLYSAAMAPWFRGRSFVERAVAAHLLTDEAFALTIAHFRRIGRFDGFGYWWAAIVTTLIPWNVATFAGVMLGGAVVDPKALGIDVIFPAAMGGLAVTLLTGRRELVAAIAGGVIGVAASVAWDPTIGVIAGGIAGPLAGLLVPEAAARETAPLGTEASAERFGMPGVVHDHPTDDRGRPS
ncbi:MAG TPA: AzlC family ABC transporter permease [Candidatus Limnocylindrales bacterium]|nr:AzlC family ABC transporter permease [Candidatus Limnocylindrales bacterium]